MTAAIQEFLFLRLTRIFHLLSRSPFFFFFLLAGMRNCVATAIEAANLFVFVKLRRGPLFTYDESGRRSFDGRYSLLLHKLLDPI